MNNEWSEQGMEWQKRIPCIHNIFQTIFFYNISFNFFIDILKAKLKWEKVMIATKYNIKLQETNCYEEKDVKTVRG